LDVVRSNLTRNLGKCFPEMHDELVSAFEDALPSNDTDWKPVIVLPTMMTIVARTTNRVFVGLPVCRNQDYMKLVIQYTIDVAVRGQLINILPSVLRPILGPFISSRNASVRKGMKYLGTPIRHRLEQEQSFGPNGPEKPNDLISWLLDHELAGVQDKTVPIIISRILATNMVAIHTTSAVLTHALFDLTTSPRYFAALRQEAEQTVEELGWTLAAVSRMHRIDSFLRETQRMHDNGPVTLARKVLNPKGFKLSDGTVLPFGTMISVASRVEHFNPSKYESPEVFDGFRFSRIWDDRRTGDEGVFNQHMISTSVEHLAFGHKRHACPGRFFAAAELKAMLAHMLINYDFRAEKEGVRPSDDVFGIVVLPNRRAKIWYRKRGD